MKLIRSLLLAAAVLGAAPVASAATVLASRAN
jgi:hypothetical protein